jgi:hypothetical protein
MQDTIDEGEDDLEESESNEVELLWLEPSVEIRVVEDSKLGCGEIHLSVWRDFVYRESRVCGWRMGGGM